MFRRSAIQWRNRGRHRRRGPLHLAAERNPQNEPKTGPYDRSPVPHDCGKPRTRANFAGFSRGARRSLPAWWREADLNPRARNGTITRPLPKVSEPAFRKKSISLPRMGKPASLPIPAPAVTAAVKEGELAFRRNREP